MLVECAFMSSSLGKLLSLYCGKFDHSADDDSEFYGSVCFVATFIIMRLVRTVLLSNCSYMIVQQNTI